MSRMRRAPSSRATVREYLAGLPQDEHDAIQAEIAEARWTAAGRALLAAHCSDQTAPPPESSRRIRKEQFNLLLHTPDGVALKVASYLPKPADLASLETACRRYWTKGVLAPTPAGAALVTAGAAAPAPEVWSVVQEAARLGLAARNEVQQGWVPRRGDERFLGLLHDVELHQLPLMFSGGTAGPHVEFRRQGQIHVGSGERADVVGVGGEDFAIDHGFESAVCGTPMRAGRHYAEITVCDFIDFRLFCGCFATDFGPCLTRRLISSFRCWESATLPLTQPQEGESRQRHSVRMSKPGQRTHRQEIGLL